MIDILQMTNIDFFDVGRDPVSQQHAGEVIRGGAVRRGGGRGTVQHGAQRLGLGGAHYDGGVEGRCQSINVEEISCGDSLYRQAA